MELRVSSLIVSAQRSTSLRRQRTVDAREKEPKETTKYQNLIASANSKVRHHPRLDLSSQPKRKIYNLIVPDC